MLANLLRVYLMSFSFVRDKLCIHFQEYAGAWICGQFEVELKYSRDFFSHRQATQARIIFEIVAGLRTVLSFKKWVCSHA
jgi:hypothetical protein